MYDWRLWEAAWLSHLSAARLSAYTGVLGQHKQHNKEKSRICIGMRWRRFEVDKRGICPCCKIIRSNTPGLVWFARFPRNMPPHAHPNAYYFFARQQPTTCKSNDKKTPTNFFIASFQAFHSHREQFAPFYTPPPKLVASRSQLAALSLSAVAPYLEQLLHALPIVIN